MYSQSNKLLDTLFRGACRATETNLRLQQELYRGWSRLTPGFSGRGIEPAEGEADFRFPWTGSILRVARAQGTLLDQQMETAINAFDTLMKIGASGDAESAAAGEAPSATQPAPAAPEKSAVEKPVAEKPAAEKPAVPAKPAATPPPPEKSPVVEIPPGAARNIYQKVAVITGAASGIGEAVSIELAKRGAKAVLLVDRSDAVNELAAKINEATGRPVADAQVGDTTDEAFRKRVFNHAMENYGPVTICVPAAGITRDMLAVRINKETGRAEIYPVETFRQVTEVNLLAPIYWGMEMVARIAEDRGQRGLRRWEPEEDIQGVVVFLGSVSSQGNKGQISYAVAKAGLEGAAATLQKEAIFHGVRCGIIHPGFTDTPMARALGEEFLNKYVLPFTQLRRLIQPEEIADAICFMISNSAVSGELWADAGWHPPA